MSVYAARSNPLLDILRMMREEEQIAFGLRAGTTRGYLYQIAGGHRKSISVQLAFSIEDASRKIHEESGGYFPAVSARDIAEMCAVAGLRPATA
jgi:hypothetical protein